MGLFGGIFKVVGKLAKAGASALTQGASDQVLKVLKGRGQQKQVLAQVGQKPTAQERAIVNKVLEGTPRPRVISTERVLDAIPYVGRPKRMKAMGKPKPPRSGSDSAVEAAYRAGWRPPRAKGKGGLRKGMLNLRVMAAQWKAAGKPGTWQGWIKANPVRV